MRMIKQTTIHLEDEDILALRKIALDKRTSMAEIIRQLVTAYLNGTIKLEK